MMSTKDQNHRYLFQSQGKEIFIQKLKYHSSAKENFESFFEKKKKWRLSDFLLLPFY